MYKIDKRSTKKQIYLYRMRNYNVVTKNGTEKTNKKGENSKEDTYEKENGVTDNGSAGGSRTFYFCNGRRKRSHHHLVLGYQRKWSENEPGIHRCHRYRSKYGGSGEQGYDTETADYPLASGGEMPDIAWLESTYRGKLLSLDIWEPIEEEPYNFDTSQVLDYLIPLETTEDGQYVGPECPSFAGMAYKRELAKEYLGTDDPDELTAMLSDWDTFIEKGKEVQEKSGGTVFMMSSLGAAGQILKGQSNTPFIEDDKINLETSMKPILETLLELKQSGTVDVLDFDSAEEGASYADDIHIFYPCANWSVKFTIKANDKEGEGRWGFMLPPGGGFPWGGTVMGVPKTAENKEGAVEYIKWIFGSEDGAIAQRDFKGNFSPYKPVYEQEGVLFRVGSLFWRPGCIKSAGTGHSSKHGRSPQAQQI